MNIDRSINCANCDKNTNTGYYIANSHGSIVCNECASLPTVQPRILYVWSALQEDTYLDAMDNENEARRDYIANGGNAEDF